MSVCVDKAAFSEITLYMNVFDDAHDLGGSFCFATGQTAQALSRALLLALTFNDALS